MNVKKSYTIVYKAIIIGLFINIVMVSLAYAASYVFPDVAHITNTKDFQLIDPPYKKPPPTNAYTPQTPPTQVQIDSAVGATPGGVVPVTSCLPPGSPSHGGRDGTPCANIGLGSGLVVTGICQAGSCRATGFTSAMSAVSSFLGGVAKSALEGITTQFISGLLNGNGGSGNYDYGSTYGTGSTSTLGDINFNDLNNTTNGDITGLDFGITIPDTTHLTYNTPTQPPSVSTVTIPHKPPAVVQQVYVVPASSSGGKTSIPGVSQFQKDLQGSTLYTDSGDQHTNNTLSLADLELSARNAQIREAQLNGQSTTNDSSLGEYRNSNVLNSNNRDTTQTEAVTKKSWWIIVVEFVGSLLGFSDNSSQ